MFLSSVEWVTSQSFSCMLSLVDCEFAIPLNWYVTDCFFLQRKCVKLSIKVSSLAKSFVFHCDIKIKLNKIKLGGDLFWEGGWENVLGDNSDCYATCSLLSHSRPLQTKQLAFKILEYSNRATFWGYKDTNERKKCDIHFFLEMRHHNFFSAVSRWMQVRNVSHCTLHVVLCHQLVWREQKNTNLLLKLLLLLQNNIPVIWYKRLTSCLNICCSAINDQLCPCNWCSTDESTNALCRNAIVMQRVVCKLSPWLVGWI